MAEVLHYVIGKDYRPLTMLEAKTANRSDIDYGNNPNWIQTRQYEDSLRQVFVDIVHEDGSAYDLTGCNVMFSGLMPDGTHRVLDNSHAVFYADPTTGKFRFDMPAPAFAVAGQYKQAFFRIFKGYKNVATLEFKFEVLADQVIEGLVPADYISPLNDFLKTINEKEDNFIKSLNKKEADAEESLQKTVNDFTNKIQDLMQKLNASATATDAEFKTLQIAFDNLQQEIKNGDLVKRQEFDQLKDKLTNEVKDMADLAKTKAYWTVADMKKDKSLKNGDMVRTLGYYGYNDGDGAVYQIKDSHPEDYHIRLDNGLDAEQINYKDNNYYDEIGYSIDRDHPNHTTCYTVTIPKNDWHGNLIMPEMNYHQEWLSPNEWARKYHTTVTLNGDASIRIGPGETYMNGNIISGGKIIHQADASKQYPSRMKSLAIMSDRSIREYQAGTSAEQMLKDGAQVAFTVYYPLVKDGQKSGYANSDNDQTDNLRAGGRVTEHYPALGLGEKPDGTWIVIGCDGRSMVDDGLTADQFAQKFIDAGCKNAWRMDGGGSTSINIRESKLNKNMDDNGAVDRKLQWTFDIRKPTAADNANSLAMGKIGEEKLNLYRSIMYDINTFYESDTAIYGYAKINSEDELNNFLNGIKDRLNESQYVNGAKLTGILTVKYWRSSVAAATGVDGPSSDFAYVFTTTGGYHNHGKIVLTSLTDPRITCWKQFRKGQDPNWSQWMMDGLSEEVSVNANGSVKNLHVTQSGNQVQIDCEVNVANNTWTDYITGLPLPGFDNQKFAVWGDGQNKQGLAVVSRGGKLTMRADTNDNYPVHYVYLTTGKKDYKVNY